MGENARNCRLILPLAAVAAAFACMPTSAAGYGMDLPEDPAPGGTTEYEFGWSASRQISGGNAVPVTLQFHKGQGTLADPGERCPVVGSPAGGAPTDGADEPVRAFKFFNDDSQPRVQMTTPTGVQNRRMIGTELHDVRREHSDTMPPGEQRVCAEPTANIREPSADMIFFGEHYWNTLNPGTKANCAEDFDDHEWIASPYYVPSEGKVYALMHQESRVHFQPAGTPCSVEPTDCTFPNASEGGCWLASITFAESSNVENCRVGRGYPPGTYVLPPEVSNETVNSLGACYQHNDTLANPFDFPTPLSEMSEHVVATIPYQYYTDWGCSDSLHDPDLPKLNGAPLDGNQLCGRHGYKELTNLIKGETGEGSSDLPNGYYLLTAVSAPRFNASGQRAEPAQKAGVCLLRATNLSNPANWRAWDGNGFDAEMRTGYTLNGADPSQHVCEPIGTSGTPWSLTYNRYLKKYMALGTGSGTNSLGQAKRGVVYQLSTDLRNWSAPQILAFAPPRNQDDAECLDGVTYPVVIDKDDPAANWAAGPGGNPNFDHPGPTPNLYYTHSDIVRPPTGPCKVATPPETPSGVGMGNVARMPIDFRAQRQATLEDGFLNPTWGFDSLSSGIIFDVPGSEAQAEKFGYGERDLTNAGSQDFVKASLYDVLSTKPHGIINTKWNHKNEVWYGAAFFLPSNFQSTHGNLDILRWDSASDFGGIGLWTLDDKFHLLGNNGGIGSGFDLPTGRWTWVEVHQKFGQNSGESPYSEVFVDGKLVISSTATNRASSGHITKLGVGFVNDDPNLNPTVTIAFDRVSILAGQRGAYLAPDTPTGLAASDPSQTLVDVTANSVQPTPAGYRLYRRNAPSGTWSQVASNTTPQFPSQGGLTCNTDYEYRITSHKLVGGTEEESIVSTPVGVKTDPC